MLVVSENTRALLAEIKLEVKATQPLQRQEHGSVRRRPTLEGGLPLFTSILEEDFSETGLPVYGVLGNSA